MRITGFLLGGIVGACAAVFMTRNNKGMKLSTFKDAGMALDNVFNSTIQKMNMPGSGIMNKMNSAMSNASSGTTNQANTNVASANMANQANTTAQGMINSDPKLKQQVEGILKESGNTNSFQTQ